MFSSLDELSLLALLFLGFLDMLYNKSWRNYRVFFTATAVLVFYLIYSLTFVHYNILKAISMDFITHMKPVIAFGITYGLAPKFNMGQKFVIKILFLSICAIGFLLYFTPYFYTALTHEYYLGSIFLCAAITLLSMLEKEDIDSIKKHLVVIVLLLLLGLVNSRSKYYGSMVVIAFMAFLYRPQIISKISPRNLFLLISLVACVIFVSWQKIQFYFISGMSPENAFDEETLATFARPVLYISSIAVLTDHFPFGSGFASFASYCSGVDYNYSSLYYKYGLNEIWGLSESFNAFVGDTFYPELAQFGIVGICLFIAAACWLYRRLKIVHRKIGIIPFAAGMCILISLGIDAIAAPGMVNSFGEMLFAILGIILAQVRNIKGTEAKECLRTPLQGESTIWLLNNELKRI